MEDGPPRFPRGFTCPAVLRYGLSCCSVSDTGLSPSMECLPSAFLLPTHRSMLTALQPHMIETIWFRLIPVRSPLLRESRLISSPAGTEMFHFPALAPLALYIQTKVTCCSMLGCPIQKSPVQRILGSSPRLIAAYHVFHRLSVPRHPPVALIILVFNFYLLFLLIFASDLFFVLVMDEKVHSRHKKLASSLI